MKFITFEGGEGSGKSTQAKLLHESFIKSTIPSILTREPGGNEAAEEIRKLILNSTTGFLPMTELLLHNAARYEHAKKTIFPALKSDKYVICDRFVDSTMAYQGFGHKLGKKNPALLHNLLMEGLAPDLTFILDISPEEGLKRTLKREENNIYEQLGIDFHKRVREGFLEIANLAKNRCIVIDATQNVDKIHKNIVENINSIFGLEIKS